MPTQDELLAGLLGGIPGGPLTQGLLATSAGLLSAGGPSYEPRSLGGALGAGMMSGLNAYQAAQQNALSQYVGATKLMQQMRQQQALNDLTQGMTPQQRALVLANPDAATGAMAKDAWTPTEMAKNVRDYQIYLNHPDELVRKAAYAQLAKETPEFKALVAGKEAGAREAGISHFIDHQIAVPAEQALLQARIMHVRPPFANFYRAAIGAVNRASNAQKGKPFAQLSAGEQSEFVGLMRQNKIEGWQGPAGAFVYTVLRADAVDVVYSTVEGYEMLGVPYMPHIAPERRW